MFRNIILIFCMCFLYIYIYIYIIFLSPWVFKCFLTTAFLGGQRDKMISCGNWHHALKAEVVLNPEHSFEPSPLCPSTGAQESSIIESGMQRWLWSHWCCSPWQWEPWCLWSFSTRTQRPASSTSSSWVSTVACASSCLCWLSHPAFRPVSLPRLHWPTFILTNRCLISVRQTNVFIAPGAFPMCEQAVLILRAQLWLNQNWLIMNSH